MPRVVDASNMNFGQGLAAGVLQSLDTELLGQRVADKVKKPKLTDVAQVGGQTISTDSAGSFFLDGLRQRELPRDLLNLADRERTIKRQDAADQRAASSEKRAQARFGMETFADLMGIQRAAEDQSMQRERQNWARDQYEHTRRIWSKEQETQAQERAAFTPLNQQYVVERMQGAQRLGAQVNPEVADSLSAAAEFMPPDKFRLMADSMFNAALTGQDTSQLSAEIMDAFEASTAMQAKARSDVASMGTKEELRKLAALQKDEEADPAEIAKATATLRIAQINEQIQRVRDGLRWQKGLPRSLTQYDAVIAGGNPATSRTGQYWQLAQQMFEAMNGRPPMGPEDENQVVSLAEKMSSQDGWMP